ncbi:MAG: DUF4288 domain-containing protein [Anaerolineae bacterium]|nr:DUF4288 domain-containing protein [Anaerolineae bacterium]
MTNEIPFRNRSPYGWWIASYLERAAWDDEPNPSPNSRCLSWENTIILQAPDREAAYAKAVFLATQNVSEFVDDVRNRKGRWVFEGLTSLLPIHEELEDGAEIFWVEHRNKTIWKIQSKVKRKEDLEAFNDK